MTEEHIKFLKNWLVGTAASTIIFLILWFTGWRKFYADAPMSISDLVYYIRTKPAILIGGPIFFGALYAWGISVYFPGRDDK